MAIIRDFTSSFSVADWTQELNVIPNQWGLIGSMGIFQEIPVAEHTVTFEEITRDGGLIVDRVRGERANVNSDYTRKIHAFSVPHFPLNDEILPQDLQGKRAYGNPGDAENMAAVRLRKMERIRQNHAWTLEYARAFALTTGNVYAPNGTVSQNWFTEFGISQTTVDFTWGTAAADQIANCEKVIAAIQDNLKNGGNISGIVALCSPGFFAKLISFGAVKTAYTYYMSNGGNQEILRNRLQPNVSNNSFRRMFNYGGIDFIEMRDNYDGNDLIPANEAYALPLGTDSFRTYFSPANRFGLVNTLGEQVYMFESAAQNGSKIDIETESNFVNALMRPQVVIKLFSSN